VQFDFEPLYDLFDSAADNGMVDILGGLLVSVLVQQFDQIGGVTLEGLRETYGWRGDLLLYEDAGDGAVGRFVWAFAFNETEEALRVWNALRNFHEQSYPDYFRPDFDSSSIDSTGKYSRVARFFAQERRCYLALEDNRVYWIDNMGRDSDVALDRLLQGKGLARSRAAGDTELRNQLYKYFPKRHRPRRGLSLHSKARG
jgi:hypothetical protein